MKNNSRRGFKKEKRYRSDNKEFGCVVRSRPGENPEKLVMRFKRLCKKSGLQNEIREHGQKRFVSKSQLKRQKKLRAIRRLTKAKG
jgi:ribosomal protein S21